MTLAWHSIKATDFGELFVELVTDVGGYEDVQWLTHTNARGLSRTLSATRRRDDPLVGTIYERVIIQFRHWPAKSIGERELAKACAKMSLWRASHAHVMVVVTSGTFTSNAMLWTQSHNAAGKHPRLELCADHHLEKLLAKRRGLADRYNLRGKSGTRGKSSTRGKRD
ncbi:restriction endonuclease [Pendulispora albinea]|uniref:Restriction endonuclease n=1 Tax=Pendulispora albinea TaxID=2741071 RepID=A0ABZ2LZ18_9BACT